jgi:integrase/recombinase XerD
MALAGILRCRPEEASTPSVHFQVLLGHSNLATTAHYTQVTPSMIARTQSPLDRFDLAVAPPT